MSDPFSIFDSGDISEVGDVNQPVIGGNLADPNVLNDINADIGTDIDAEHTNGDEPKFGISISAGKTVGGDPVNWSTANRAGGEFINARTGAVVDPV